MWEQGFLDTAQMAGAFQMLRSNDLIWSYMIRNYLMGEREPMTDLMAWNADATRMPYRMHSEYLRRLFLNNDLAEGRYRRRRQAGVALRHPRADLRRRHRARPRRALALDLQDPRAHRHRGDLSADHRRPQRRHRLGAGPQARAATRSRPSRPTRRTPIPTPGRQTTEHKQGSWWPEWSAWLAARSGAPVAPPAMPADGRGAARRPCALDRAGSPEARPAKARPAIPPGGSALKNQGNKPPRRAAGAPSCLASGPRILYPRADLAGGTRRSVRALTVRGRDPDGQCCRGRGPVGRRRQGQDRRLAFGAGRYRRPLPGRP